MDRVVLLKTVLDCTVMCPRARSPARAGLATLSHQEGAPGGGFSHPGLGLYRLPGALAGASIDVGLPSKRCVLAEMLSHAATMQRSCRRQHAAYGDEQGFCRDRVGQNPQTLHFREGGMARGMASP